MIRHLKLLNGKEIALECNAASPIIYKRYWDEDLMNSFQNMSTDDSTKLVNFMEKVVYTFAKTAELGTMGALKHDADIYGEEYIAFLSQFEFIEMITGDALSVVTEMWGVNIKSESEPKNQQSPQQENTP